jgi:hypothetical protein
MFLMNAVIAVFNPLSVRGRLRHTADFAAPHRLSTQRLSERTVFLAKASNLRGVGEETSTVQTGNKWRISCLLSRCTNLQQQQQQQQQRFQI